MALHALSAEQDTAAGRQAGFDATLQHIALLKRKQERLHEAQLGAEEQLLHSIAAAYVSGDLDMTDLAGAFNTYRQVAAPGFKTRWNAVVPVTAASMMQWPRMAPNGPAGSWTGTNPIGDGRAPGPGVCVVYVLFDVTNQPCYVGSTSHFRPRLSGHRNAGKSFTRWVAYPANDREDAYQLEERLLAEHMPYLNKKRGR